MGIPAHALEVQFTDPSRAVDCTYVPSPGGTAVPVRGIVRRIDQEQPLGFANTLHPGWKVHIRRTDVSVKPTKLATIQPAGGAVLTVQAVREDEMNLTWVLDCRG
jgi:hypothetical protein